MSNQVVTRTLTASLTNHSQLSEDLDSHGFAASKLWNIGRWTISRVWDGIDHIPGAGELCSSLKSHDRYADLHSQSSHRVLQELGEAFVSWYKQDDPDANPPGYRKHGDEHPRSTVTWKNQGFKLDTTDNRVRLCKGTNMKQSRYAADYILCEYTIQADEQTLEDVESIQTVRAVWTGDEWELHFVCEMQIDQPESPGEKTAGIDRGICNTAAVSVGTETLLCPGNALNEAHYFRQEESDTEGENGPSAHAEWARQKKSRRQHHFLHALSKEIVEQCAKRDVGTRAVGHPKNSRDDSDWGRHGNERLHDWAFETLLSHIEYTAEDRGIDIKRTPEAKLKTSQTCCECGTEADSNRVERGLHVCETCELVANSE